MANKGIEVGECTHHGEYHMDAGDSPCPSCEDGLIENNETNRGALAHHIVEGWDMDDLVTYAISMLQQHYENDDESFQCDADQCGIACLIYKSIPQ